MKPADLPLQPARPKLYSVPRRYNLATLFTVSLAFSLMFGGMRLARLPAAIFAVVAGFIAFVGIAQALLFRGKAPRAASIVGGAIFWIGGHVISAVYMQDDLQSGFAAALCGTPVGALLGYVAGVFVGSVFLVADLLGRWFRGRQRS